ncbi:MAG: NADH-quinone oxidoreductase subunit M [Candidatus Scalindua rubra]|uniref:NADH:ubiquinone oxidoreductase subunit M n=1 Tax=Candidatus Scalindua brodae TaxID=237368 RepID=A0A0B0ENM5_9BACT|nr:MAG: NADH:ubiquinone oxidoreductase subunit M [Candidatus Scalindua brodae]MBZ0109047.1 NADH-quinone oxidoreductase subunit M [Candidatus Scalindua rubra]
MNCDCPILTIVTFLPLFGAIILLFINGEKQERIKRVALAIAIIDFIISLPLFFLFKLDTSEFQFVQNVPWIKEFGISYHIGIDGISLFLFLLTSFLSLICILASWNIKDRIKEYMIAMLILQTGMLGVFISLDLFLFYMFWELMLIPMYLIIGVWGGPRRIYATIKFFVYTMAGSVLMLIAIIFLYFMHYNATGEYTFDLLKIYSLDIPLGAQFWLFLAFFFAFAIKVPMFPFHTWLPDAHVEAPTAGSVILAGVMLKMGTYGFVRFSLPLFPYASHQFVPLITWLAVAGIIYGALVAMVQEDLKKLVAYSSVSHLGFVILGIFVFNVQGMEGGILQMVNHGLSTGALFLIVGMLYERRHTRLIADYGGVTKKMPILAVFFMVMTLSSIGLPGLNGFVGEFLVLLGTFKSNVLLAVVATTGVILSACYMLWMFQRVMFNKITNPENAKLKDINGRECALLLPITMLIFWIGIYPKPILSRMDVSVNHLLMQVDEKYKATLNKLGKNENVLAVSESKSADYIINEARTSELSHNPVERLIKLWK